MALKQSDKIIAIVGVIILIVAAFAIVIYAPEDDESVEQPSKMKKFEVTWVKDNFSVIILGEAYNNYCIPFTILTEPGSVITDVDIEISWQDDNTWGLITKGEDKLKADITYNGETKTYEETGGGAETLIFMVYDIPKATEIESKDIDEARGMLTSLEPNKCNATFDVDVTVTVGEKFKLLNPIRSFLNKRKDTGNDFELKITYNYYMPCLSSNPKTDGELNLDDENDETSQKEDFRTTGVNFLIGGGYIK
jgi:hypothetical protein